MKKEGISDVISEESRRLQVDLEGLSIDRAKVKFLAQQDSFDLLRKDPREVITQLVSDIPDTPRIVARQEALELSELFTLRDGSRSRHDHGEISPLEAYLVVKTALHSSDPFEFTHLDEYEDGVLSPAESIHCLRDGVRTKRFLQAIESAIHDLVQTIGRDCVTVCDAGAGAIPVLGIYAALQSPNVQVTCLETNEQSVHVAQAAIEMMGLQDRIMIRLADARTYVPEEKIDLVVSETMDTGLLNEPLVAIQENLSKYLHSRGKILPSRVEVFASLLSHDAYANAQQYTLIDTSLTPIVDTDWTKIGEYVPGTGVPEFSGNLLLGTRDACVVMVASKVQLGNVTPGLDLYDARITSPLSIPTEENQTRIVHPTSDTPVHISYVPGTLAHEVTIG